MSTEKSQQQLEAEHEEYEIIERDPPAEGQQGTSTGENDDDDQEDERLSDSLNADEDTRREQRRLDRRRRKESQKYARDRTREELQTLYQQNQHLQQRLQQLETQSLQAQKGSLDQNYNQALGGVQYAEQQLAKAIEIGDGARVPELLRQRDQALARAAEINRTRQQMNAPPAPAQQAVDPQVTAVVQRRAMDWASDHDWFNPNGTDPDSMIAKAVDASLVAEGFDPTTKRYWSELDRRLAERLPHRFADNEDMGYTGEETRPARRGPPVGGGRDIAPGKKKVFLSEARVNAIKEAGAWDDRVRRDAMIRRFQEWDRENNAAR